MVRERWDKRTSFIMAAIGSAIGLGNIWRFPYMAYANGGGAFFIPYLIALVTTGIPLMALEYYLGIRYQRGPTAAYGHIRKGADYIGWFALGTTAMVTCYYCVVISWAWNYLIHSVGLRWAGREEIFFFDTVLKISRGVGEIGSPSWKLVLGNLATWLVIFVIIFKGIRIVGRVVNWTVSIPWVLLLIMIVRGITLEGSSRGLGFYLGPDFSELLNPRVWLGAYGQIFFSLSLGFGIMIAYASYLPRDSDIVSNSWIVSFSNCLTSYLAGFAVFSVLGYLAVHTNQPLLKVVDTGPGLAFVTYPAAIAMLPGGPAIQSLYGIVFFSMLITLGIDSAFSLVEALVTGLMDSFGWSRAGASAVTCLGGFTVGFLYTSGGGFYWLDIIDHWMNWGLVTVGLMEAVLVGWFYDAGRVAMDIDSTSEIRLGRLWVFSIRYITPAVLVVTMLSSMYREFQAPYGGYPIWSLMVGWSLLVGLMFLAFHLGGRKETTVRYGYARFLGWVLIYAGILLAFYMFYADIPWILSGTALFGAALGGFYLRRPGA